MHTCTVKQFNFSFTGKKNIKKLNCVTIVSFYHASHKPKLQSTVVYLLYVKSFLLGKYRF